MDLIAWFAPFFATFEVAQLIVAHRYIGPDQIRSRVHPLDGSAALPAVFTTGWMVMLMLDYWYQVILLFQAYPIPFAGFLLIMVSLGGYGLRRNCGLKWGMVLLTFEGATRAGLLAFVFIDMVIHPYHWPRYYMIF